MTSAILTIPPLRANRAETPSPALITEQGENGNQNEYESEAERICLGQPAASSPTPARPNPEVVADARRRSFSLDYKLRILKEAEAVKAIGGILALDDMAPGARGRYAASANSQVSRPETETRRPPAGTRATAPRNPPLERRTGTGGDDH